MGIKHKRHATRPQTPDVDAIQSQDWNDDHEVDGVVAALLPLAPQPDTVPYIKSDLTGGLSALSSLGRVLIAMTAESDIMTRLGALSKSGDAMSGPLALGNNKITGLGTPTAPGDAVTKAYADALITALSGALVFKGAWDASAGTFPNATGRKVGWFYKVSVAGTVDGKSFSVGDDLFAIVDDAAASTYADNWLKIEGTLTLAEIEAAVGFTFGTAAALNAGTSVGNLVQIITGGKLPALDGSLLTNIAASAVAWAAITGKPAFGSAALLNAGTSVGDLVQIITGGKLPALDGSNLTNIGGAKNGLVALNAYLSSQTVTIPAGATRAIVLMCGGTGGGAALGTAGAGAGAALKYLPSLTPGNTLAWTQGAAGATTPGAGGNSSLASGTQTISTITANGGGAGFADVSGINQAVSAGGTATGGDVNITGQSGAAFAGQTSGDQAATIGGLSGFGLGKGGDANVSGNTAGVAGFALVWWFS